LTVLKNGVKGTHAAGFPRVCVGCNRAIITVANKPTLSPGRKAFAFGASIRLSPKQAPANRDPNIVAMGSNRHHRFKLHLLGAKPRCVFGGTSQEVIITSKTPIDDRTWHRVVCARQGKLDRLFVDGKLKASSTTTYTGAITSTSPLKIGGRAVGHAGSNDQFHGDLDNVFLHIGNGK
jgi:Concanavalin A-like lectin/glucanases superfamily